MDKYFGQIKAPGEQTTKLGMLKLKKSIQIVSSGSTLFENLAILLGLALQGVV